MVGQSRLNVMLGFKIAKMIYIYSLQIFNALGVISKCHPELTTCNLSSRT